MDREQKSILTLHLLPEIGPRRMQRLIGHFGSAASALEAAASDLRAVEEIPSELAARIAGAERDVDVDGEIASAQKIGAQIFTYIDAGYPDCLRNLSDFPSVIYVRGALEAHDTAGVAVVGTRHPTNYGRTVAAQFAAAFARDGITTVSGLARGIDTEVHQSSLAEGGRTIAVLGNGFNHHYPPENKRLEEKIVSCGALVTEFSMNAFPDRIHFPLRNRIISGLSCATVVVEASAKSGALITARYAADQGRDVFAVPGPIESEYSKGPHYLLKAGARLAESAHDVISELRGFGELFPSPQTLRKNAAMTEIVDPRGRQLLELIHADTNGVSIDALTALSGLPAGILAQQLLDLELKGLIRGLPGKMYIRHGGN
jgi:DNA processing protein